MKYIIIGLSLLLTWLVLMGCQKNEIVYCDSSLQYGLAKNKICGMSFTAPKNPFKTDPVLPLKNLGVKWISCLPYAIFYKNKPTVHTIKGAWWGETTTGLCETVNYAHRHNVKVMLKPQIWNWEQWVGDLDMETEAEWDTFEQSYTRFIIKWAQVADSMNIDMFCVGTEIKNAVDKRPNYWRGLIDSIRTIYTGKLTYASNWDDYDKVQFWDKLDYVGVDAYFPLHKDKTPSVCDLKEAWQPTVKKLKIFSDKWQKPILFTEFGYLSLNGCAYNTWELEKKRGSVAVNQEAQANAIQALLETFAPLDWWAGGFQWKWYPNLSAALGEGDARRDYTPQDKLCEKVLKAMYK